MIQTMVSMASYIIQILLTLTNMKHPSMKFSVFLLLTLLLISSSVCDKDGGFGSGSINLGGLQLLQLSNFSKVWEILEGGPDNAGATFYEPSSVPDGYFMLGSYAQANNKPLLGWVLAAKDSNSSNLQSSGMLKPPLDYTLAWSSESADIRINRNGYFWLPNPPDSYNAVGLVVTNSSDKPPVDLVRCVRADLVEDVAQDEWLWGADTEFDGHTSEISVYRMRPKVTGVSALGIEVGTFGVQVGEANTLASLYCLKNINYTLSYMPNITEIEALVETYSPLVYLHPDEPYLPSSVNWFFNKGAQLHQKWKECHPSSIDSDGLNLPKGGSDNEEYWLDLPINEIVQDEVKKGDLQSAVAYLHVKPMLGATFTDICFWFFYPFNGAARAKLNFIKVIKLGDIGEHVGDWEHLTLRVSNFDGRLWRVYFAQHRKGVWLDASQLEFVQGTKKVVAYSSLHGHALYPKPGVNLQGVSEIGIGLRNDAAKSNITMDTGIKYRFVSAEHLDTIVEPSWLNYSWKWGPKVVYDTEKGIEIMQNVVPGLNISHLFPHEVLGGEGPSGPKGKSNWSGDEII